MADNKNVSSKPAITSERADLANAQSNLPKLQKLGKDGYRKYRQEQVKSDLTAARATLQQSVAAYKSNKSDETLKIMRDATQVHLDLLSAGYDYEKVLRAKELEVTKLRRLVNTPAKKKAK